ncbi:hypothetical protein [Planotetraspora sp. GP83]|uniref:hypothetical protein n=1 Tax=Planotetraspora sp. GP83 TaxID=3156264 RepID=UPI003518B530
MGRHRRGKMQGIETVGDLIDALERFDPDLEVRFAVQPRMPMSYTVGPLAEFDDILWIGEAKSDGYVPDDAATRLGWR